MDLLVEQGYIHRATGQNVISRCLTIHEIEDFGRTAMRHFSSTKGFLFAEGSCLNSSDCSSNIEELFITILGIPLPFNKSLEAQLESKATDRNSNASCTASFICNRKRDKFIFNFIFNSVSL